MSLRSRKKKRHSSTSSVDHSDGGSEIKDLFECARSSSTVSNFSRLLKKAKGKDNASSIKDKKGSTLLHAVAEGGGVDAAETLIKQYNCDANAEDGLGRTPLHVALIHGHTDVALKLLECGGDAKVVSKSDLSNALHLLAKLPDCSSSTFRKLFKALADGGVQVASTNKNGDTALHISALYGNTYCVQHLIGTPGVGIDAQNEYGDTPLHYAIRGGKIDLVKLFVRQGASLSIVGSRGDALATAKKERKKIILKIIEDALNAQRINQEIGEEDPARYSIVKEILATERKYALSLTTLVLHYLRPIQRHRIVPTEDADLIFSNIERILEFHKVFVKEMEDRVANWTKVSTIGELFVKFHSYFKLYMQYINNFEKSDNALKTAVKNSRRFKEFCDKVKKHPDVKSMDLETFLIMPVQRIPRYVLLLSDLLKKTPEDHVGRQGLMDAIAKMKDIGDYLNKQKTVSLQREKVAELAKKMSDYPGKLVQPGRMFVTESTLVAINDKGEIQHRQFFLFSDVLVVCNMKMSFRMQFTLAKCGFGDISPPHDLPSDMPKNLARRWFELCSVEGLDILLAANSEEDLAFIGALQVELDRTAGASATCAHAAGNAPSSSVTNFSLAFIEDSAYCCVPLDTGGSKTHVLNLSSMRWAEIRVNDAPDGRENFVSCGTRRLVLLHGGRHWETDNLLDDVAVLDTQSDTYSPLHQSGEKPSARCNHSSQVLGESWFIFGGQDANDKYLNDLWELTPVPDDGSALIKLTSWTKHNCAHSPPPRCCAASTGTDSRLFLFGGHNDDGPLNDLWIFDTRTLRWSEVKLRADSAIPSKRTGAAALVFGSWLVIYGGINQHDEVLGDLWAMNVLNRDKGWALAPMQCLARTGHTLIEFDSNLWGIGGKLRDSTISAGKDPCSDVSRLLGSDIMPLFDKMESSARRVLGRSSGKKKRSWIINTGKSSVSISGGKSASEKQRASPTADIVISSPSTGGAGSENLMKSTKVAQPRALRPSPRASSTGQNSGDSGDVSSRSVDVSGKTSPPIKSPAVVEAAAVEKSSGHSPVAAIKKFTRKRRDSFKKDQLEISSPVNFSQPVSVSSELTWAGDMKLQDAFELIQQIGAGGFGEVWEAKHKAGGFIVAVKIIRETTEGGRDTIAALSKEIEMLKALRHKYVVPYYGASEIDKNTLWIFMALAELGSVADIMERCQVRLNEHQIALVCTNVLDGLSYLHAQNIVHRDVKAGNILVNSKGEAMLTDFGLSERTTTALKVRAGTPHHMAPEVIQKKGSNAKSDIWSLGVTCITMFDGEPPFWKLEDAAAMDLIVASEPPTLCGQFKHSKEFASFIARCVDKNPDTRPSARQMAADVFLSKMFRSDAFKSLIAKFGKIQLPGRSWGSPNVGVKARSVKESSSEANRPSMRARMSGKSYQMSVSESETPRQQKSISVKSAGSEQDSRDAQMLVLALREQLDDCMIKIRKMRMTAKKRKARMRKLEEALGADRLAEISLGSAVSSLNSDDDDSDLVLEDDEMLIATSLPVARAGPLGVGDSENSSSPRVPWSPKGVRDADSSGTFSPLSHSGRLRVDSPLETPVVETQSINAEDLGRDIEEFLEQSAAVIPPPDLNEIVSLPTGLSVKITDDTVIPKRRRERKLQVHSWPLCVLRL